MQPTNPTWQGYPPAAVKPPRKRHRVFLWVFLGIQALFVIWIVLGAAGAHDQTVADCLKQNTFSTQDCQSAGNTGAAIGVGIIIALWVAVDLILGITYAVIRASRRR